MTDCFVTKPDVVFKNNSFFENLCDVYILKFNYNPRRFAGFVAPKQTGKETSVRLSRPTNHAFRS